MRTQLYINGELRTVDIEDGRITTVNDEPKEVEIKTGWERLELMQRYYTTDGESQLETYHSEDAERYESADYFSDPTLVADVARAQTIWRKLMRWQVENDALVTWDNVNFRYAIYYNNFYGKISVASMISAQETFNVYFNTAEKANQAIEIFKDDLLWLFTKFNPRVEGGVE